MTHELQIKDISLMAKICHQCHEDYTIHSFNLVCHTLEGGHIFYTKITNASKYNDTDGILHHCTNYLQYINSKKWSWIIDLEGFGFRHMSGFNTCIQLSKLINSFGRLHNLIIINSNVLVEKMSNMVISILNKEYHQCICCINSEQDYIKKIKEWVPMHEADYTLLLSLITKTV